MFKKIYNWFINFFKNKKLRKSMYKSNDLKGRIINNIKPNTEKIKYYTKIVLLNVGAWLFFWLIPFWIMKIAFMILSPTGFIQILTLMIILLPYAVLQIIMLCAAIHPSGPSTYNCVKDFVKKEPNYEEQILDMLQKGK